MLSSEGHVDHAVRAWDLIESNREAEELAQLAYESLRNWTDLDWMTKVTTQRLDTFLAFLESHDARPTTDAVTSMLFNRAKR